VMSVLRTAKQQGRNLIGTVKLLVQRHLAGQPCQPGDPFPAPPGQVDGNQLQFDGTSALRRY
jgi:hypothetical protein